ncbi:hypothetical protein FQN52_007439 [Onygenales sp. PD_12]|nr:hypothetical protein FQN52_007439 [Onygenales sp. PD_12]
MADFSSAHKYESADHSGSTLAKEEPPEYIQHAICTCGTPQFDELQRSPQNPDDEPPDLRAISQKVTEETPVTKVGLMTSPSSIRSYQVGWICAVETEYAVAMELLDEKFQVPPDVPEEDENVYTFGRIGVHYLAITCLAKGKYGPTSAAYAATDMLRSFPTLRFGLVVGVGGGAPSEKHDVRLGDVVVSTPSRRSGGVINYDFGKMIQNQGLQMTGILAPPPHFLLNALQQLSTLHECRGHQIAGTINGMVRKNPRLQKYRKPDMQTDILYRSAFAHPDSGISCTKCCGQSIDHIVARPQRDPHEDDPIIHYGLIASGSKVMKDAMIRDRLAEMEQVLCFEMEAAGVMDRFPCVVIRGIGNYSDTHKNDLWKGYAAATAAAYAKELLGVIPGHGPRGQLVG